MAKKIRPEEAPKVDLHTHTGLAKAGTAPAPDPRDAEAVAARPEPVEQHKSSWTFVGLGGKIVRTSTGVVMVQFVRDLQYRYTTTNAEVAEDLRKHGYREIEAA